jgi:hypothetical protein
VPDQRPDDQPARDPDRPIKWFIGVFLVNLGVNLLSVVVLKQRWAWVPPLVFAAALLVVAPKTGLLRRERHGGETRWARGLAILALAGYLGTAVWGAAARWPIAVMILSVMFLWGAGVPLL